MSEPYPAIDRRLELLVDQTLHGLDPAATAELAALTPTSASDHAADRSLELAAAAVSLAVIDRINQPDLPPDLAARVEFQALQYFGFAADRVDSGPTPRRQWGRGRVAPWLGWIAAAAALAVICYDRAVLTLPPLVVSGPPVPRTSAPPRSVPSVRLLASAHPLAQGAGGVLAWDADRQEGTLRVEGLAAVDPRSGCYQLWIFDGSRDERYPVDGGIFTVPRATAGQDPVVTIRPQVPVRTPTLFAITLEPPGGVVVSDRERILLTAAWTPSAPL